MTLHYITIMFDNIPSTDILWSENFWLPSNTTWDSLKDIKIEIARYEDLWFGYPLAIIFLMLRWICNRWIFSPFAIAMGMKDSSSNFVAHFNFLLICCLYQIGFCVFINLTNQEFHLPHICCSFAAYIQFGFGQSTIWQI